MRASRVPRLLRDIGGVDATIDNVSSPLPGHLPDFVSAQRIAGMNAYTDNIAASMVEGSVVTAIHPPEQVYRRQQESQQQERKAIAV